MATPTALPTTFVAGDILTAANMNLVRGAFRVLQVVQGSTATVSTTPNNGTAYQDSGLTATITPLYNTSKVLVLISQAGISNNNAAGAGTTLQLMRDGVSQLIFGYSIGYSGSAAITRHNASGLLLDSPATTAAVTYKTQFKNITASGTVSVQVDNAVTSTIILCEISA